VRHCALVLEIQRVTFTSVATARILPAGKNAASETDQ
jgi:hypothetical protein